MSELEKKWWWVFLVAILTTICTLYLMESAGMPRTGEYNVAQWIVHMLCYAIIWRGLSFTGWLLVVCVEPSLASAKPKKVA